MRVLPDEAAIDKVFDYRVPEGLDGVVEVGARVRVPLHGRRIGGWIVDVDAEPPEGVDLRPIAKLSGYGPTAELIDLAGWAAWRWAGRRATFLRTASPERVVAALPGPAHPGAPLPTVTNDLVSSALAGGVRVLRLPPAADSYDVLLAAAGLGNSLFLAPSVRLARRLGLRLRRAGVPVGFLPEGWAQARSGSTVIGARAAAWAPMEDLRSVVVLDEHDEVYQEERAPTWHARDVVIERARRAGVPCVLVSPTPTLEALGVGPLVATSRSGERSGWPIVQVIDRRSEDIGRSGLYSSALVDQLRSAERSVCVLNRTGRSRLLACAACGELARCSACGSAVKQDEPEALTCRRCDVVRPPLCTECGGLRLKNLRVGVSRAREELEALLGRTVVESTGSTAGTDLASAGAYVGTEAVLHQVESADVVAYLDFDQELMAPRYRAAEQALTMLVRGARLVGGRGGGGRLVVQTRLPRHEVVLAAVHADPARVADAESARRRELGRPPYTAMAEVSGASAERFMANLGRPLGLEILGPRDDRWLVKAPDHRQLCDALAAVARPPGRLRVAVDPARV